MAGDESRLQRRFVLMQPQMVGHPQVLQPQEQCLVQPLFGEESVDRRIGLLRTIESLVRGRLEELDFCGLRREIANGLQSAAECEEVALLVQPIQAGQRIRIEVR